MCRVINVLSHKGGCGKSETVLNLAYGLHAKGKRVLVIDCDPQSNVTSILTAESSLTTGDSNQLLENYRARTETGFMAALAALGEYVQSHRDSRDIHDVKEGNCSSEEAICRTKYENVDIIPSGIELSMTDYQLKNRSLDPYRALRSGIQQVKDAYDYVIIDNQPFKNALTFNTIASCTEENDLIIIPTKINRGGLEGTYETIMTTMEWLKTDRLPLDIKILATMVNRNKLEKTWIDTLSELFGDKMFRATIRYQAKPVEEASLKKSILLENMTSGVAQDYQALVDELVD